VEIPLIALSVGSKPPDPQKRAPETTDFKEILDKALRKKQRSEDRSEKVVLDQEAQVFRANDPRLRISSKKFAESERVKQVPDGLIAHGEKIAPVRTGKNTPDLFPGLHTVDSGSPDRKTEKLARQTTSADRMSGAGKKVTRTAANKADTANEQIGIAHLPGGGLPSGDVKSGKNTGATGVTSVTDSTVPVMMDEGTMTDERTVAAKPATSGESATGQKRTVGAPATASAAGIHHADARVIGKSGRKETPVAGKEREQTRGVQVRRDRDRNDPVIARFRDEADATAAAVQKNGLVTKADAADSGDNDRVGTLEIVLDSVRTGEEALVSQRGNPASGTRTEVLSQLSNRFRDDIPKDIVRQAQILLKNSDSAEIRLVIRPPELGRVQIRMNVDNGHIAGRILVDNGNVREIIEQNLAHLQRAFEEQGLQMGQFDIESRDDSRNPEENRDEGSHRASVAKAAGRFEEGGVLLIDRQYEHMRVNIVA